MSISIESNVSKETSDLLKENELLKVIEYLYDEGFIPDRRVEYEVIRGEDFL